LSLAPREAPRHARPVRPYTQLLLAARALGLGATLTTLYLQFEKEAEAALGLPPGFHSYALLPIGYPMGRFGPVRRIALADVVYEDRWGQPYAT
jgi:nitroreductase